MNKKRGRLLCCDCQTRLARQVSGSAYLRCIRCAAENDGRNIRPVDRLWTMGEVKQLRNLRQQGMTCTECARQLNRTLFAIRNACIFHGISRPLYGKRANGQLMREVRALVRKGRNDAEIADILGVCKCTVNRARKRCGLKSAVNWSKVARQREAIKRMSLETLTRKESP